MCLIKEMGKKVCYGFSFGIGIGLSINFLPKNERNATILPGNSITKNYNKEEYIVKKE